MFKNNVSIILVSKCYPRLCLSKKSCKNVLYTAGVSSLNLSASLITSDGV